MGIFGSKKHKSHTDRRQQEDHRGQMILHPDLRGAVWFANGPDKNWPPDEINTVLNTGNMKLTVSNAGEPSVIDLRYPVAASADPEITEPLSYYPSYAKMTPQQRRLYWDFLADPYSGRANIGYVFTLYYGLERHLLTGNRAQALHVILNLRDVYENSSFQNYSANAILLTAVLTHDGNMIREFFRSLDKEYEMQFSRNLLLNVKWMLGVPVMPAEIIEMMQIFGFRKKAYVEEHSDIFFDQLSRIISEQYDDGEIRIDRFLDEAEYAALPKSEVPLFANMELQDLKIMMADITKADKFTGAMHDLLEEAHRSVKKMLAHDEAGRESSDAEYSVERGQAAGRSNAADDAEVKERDESEHVQEAELSADSDSDRRELSTEKRAVSFESDERDKKEASEEQQTAHDDSSASDSESSVQPSDGAAIPAEPLHIETSDEETVPGVFDFFTEPAPFASFALQQNGLAILPYVLLKNGKDEPARALRLRVRSDSGFIRDFEQMIPDIPAESSVLVEKPGIILDSHFLVSITEPLTASFRVSVLRDEEELAAHEYEIQILTYEQWQGFKFLPETISSFIMPNHPAVPQLMHRASEYLTNWGQEPMLEGYQMRDPNRARMLAAAAYAAIQEKNIIYAMPPSSFMLGQRVRLPDAVMEQHMGTCLDMTFLYAALLEAMGLNPILVLMEGHIFAGLWLVDSSFQDVIIEDPVELEKRMSDGINEITFVECTAMCSGKTLSFEEAEKYAKTEVGDYADFQFAFDVARSRALGIRPMPARVRNDSGYEIIHTERSEDDVTELPDELENIIPEDQPEKKITKLDIWERKLLDLSMRNMLLNMRMTKSIIPLLSAKISELEDALADGDEFLVLGMPKELALKDDFVLSFENSNAVSDGPAADLIRMECRHGRLHTLFTDSATEKMLTQLYRSAKTSMEENGASTLYMTLGLLRWIEKDNDVLRYAPLVLIPIEITRKSARKGYALHMRSEEPRFNTTLLEMLKQEFSITIPGLDPLPADEHGIDMKKVFALTRRAVMDQHAWDVIESGFIGNFSFSQFVMWNDIHGKEDFLRGNKIVKSFLDGNLDENLELDDNHETDDQPLFLPVEADDSQIRAIRAGARDESFVLQGPPGTGKSQTITALIANAVANGRTILFVAEKMAALSVVKKRLDAIGLSDHCLELYSNKADKKELLAHFERLLQLSESESDGEYVKRREEMTELYNSLDEYRVSLHQVRKCGRSLYEMIMEYSDLPDSMPSIDIDYENIRDKNEDQIRDMNRAVRRLAERGAAADISADHPLYGVTQKEYSQNMKNTLPYVIDELVAALRELEVSGGEFSASVSEAAPAGYDDWMRLRKKADYIISCHSIPEAVRGADAGKIIRAAETTIQKKNALSARKRGLLMIWNEAFLRQDIARMESDLRTAENKRFGKARAVQNVLSEIESFANQPVQEERIHAMLAEVQLYQQDAAAFEAENRALPAAVFEVVSMAERGTDLETLLRDVRRVQAQSSVIGNIDVTDELCEAAQRYRDSVRKKDDAMSLFQRILSFSFDERDADDLVSEWIMRLEKIRDNESMLRSWILYVNAADECRENGLGAVVEAYEGGLRASVLSDACHKGFLYSYISGCISEEPVLNRFTGVTFREIIERFTGLDKQIRELTKQEIVTRLVSNIPLDSESKEMGRELHALRRAIASSGRGMSVRNLFDQMPNLLTRLTPCMLMSPISAAQYLRAENGLFDTVVFDEASQIPTCKAAGVLARGRNAVIVGDPNQMPPSSFFGGNAVDEDNLDIEDLESVLDDCIAIGIPQMHLDWHYRSRHESLIAFSNFEFYHNKMLTFPSVNDRESRVRLIRTDGIFDRGKSRQNRVEAEAIVNEIKKRYHDPEKRGQSVGVVTFNISQQTLIEDMLQAEYQKDADFDNWANSGNDPVFVKNLENVQGDERDVILFSIAFGPDRDGRISMNFGPINREGGWKRLNVAASRARNEMIVFTSLDPEQIDLRRTSSRGVAALKEFLTYAAGGNIRSEHDAPSSAGPGGVASAIASGLEKEGYSCSAEIGRSDFKIDLAVINPYNKNTYLLGIMLDGEVYEETENVRDREVGQPEILKGLGWELMRIWTIDWWDDPDREMRRILDRLALLKKRAEKEHKANLVKQKEHLQRTVNVPELDEHETEHNADEEIQRQESAATGETEDEKVSENISEEYRSEAAGQRSGSVAASAYGLDTASEPEKSDDVSGASENEKTDTSLNNRPVHYSLEQYTDAALADTPMTMDEFIAEDAWPVIDEKIRTLVNEEGPVSLEIITKKLIKSCGISRTTQNVTDAVDQAVHRMKLRPKRLNGLKTFWPDGLEPEKYTVFRTAADSKSRRDLDLICMQEKKNAVCYALQEKGPLDKQSLIKETSVQMGYGRLGESQRTAIEAAVKYAVKSGEIRINEDKLYILCQSD